MKSPLIEKFGNEPRWVNWKLEKTKDDKSTKIPYQTKTKKASTTDPSTWNTYESVSTALDNGSNGFSGVGIVLHDNKLICIDIDHVIEDGKIFSPLADSILNLLKASDSFTEISQSGTGIHIFLECERPFTPLANKKAPFEVYADVRYIATTNNSYHKVPKDIKTVTEDELNTILSTIGYPWGKDKTSPEATESSTTSETHQVVLSDVELLNRMFKSKNGDSVKKLYNGDIIGYEDDASKADMALLAHLAFWTVKDPKQMESIWKNSPLGNRKKTQDRKDYRDRSIRNAIANCTKTYELPVRGVHLSKDEEFLVVVKDKGSIVIPCQENVLIALRTNADTQGKFRYNIWLDRKETLLESNEWRAVRDNDYNLVKSILAKSYTHMALITASPTFVTNAIIQYCEENSVDPAKEYFENLKWDGVDRLDTWVSKTYNTVGNEKEYSIIGRQWLKALVKRVIFAGCKFDNVLVLEGEQGTKKSTSLAVLGKDWHVELTTNPSDKDFFLLMKGHTIVEFSEGEIQERSSMKLLKSIITTQVDTYRAPYARETEAHPRRCVFAMTTNDSKYLKDETGNRRWLPIACVGQANVEWLEENRDQLFAEAYHRAVTLKEDIFDGLSSDVIIEMQDQRREERAEESYITDWYEDLPYSKKLNGITIDEAFQGSIKRGDVLINQFQKKIIGSILTNVLKLVVKRETKGDRKYKYFPTDKTFKVVGHGEEDLLSSLHMPDLEDVRDGKHF
jgi:hypothetical protein